jgi:hypothetical protein
VEEWSLLAAGSFLALVFVGVGGVLGGALMGEGGCYHRRYLAERDILAPALAADPAFARVEIHERSNGGVYFFGDVPTSADLDRLRGLTVRAIGEAWAKESLSVEVRR